MEAADFSRVKRWGDASPQPWWSGPMLPCVISIMSDSQALLLVEVRILVSYLGGGQACAVPRLAIWFAPPATKVSSRFWASIYPFVTSKLELFLISLICYCATPQEAWLCTEWQWLRLNRRSQLLEIFDFLGWCSGGASFIVFGQSQSPFMTLTSMTPSYKESRHQDRSQPHRRQRTQHGWTTAATAYHLRQMRSDRTCNKQTSGGRDLGVWAFWHSTVYRWCPWVTIPRRGTWRARGHHCWRFVMACLLEPRDFWTILLLVDHDTVQNGWPRDSEKQSGGLGPVPTKKISEHIKRSFEHADLWTQGASFTRYKIQMFVSKTGRAFCKWDYSKVVITTF